MCCDRNEVAPNGFSSAERMIIYESVYSQMRNLRSHAAGWAFLNGSDRTKSNGATAANPSGANIERKMWEIAGRVRWFQIGNTLAAATSGASVLSGAGSGLTMGGGYETVPPGKFYQGLSPTDNSTGAYGGLAGFYSETAGGMGIPTVETLKRVLPEANWWPYNKGNGGVLGDGPGNYNIWNYLNARGGCFESLDVSNLYVESAFGPSKNIDEYNIKAQLFQYDQQRAIHEALHVTRFSKGTGFVNWMLNSPRPSTFWNQFDFYLNPIGNSFGSEKGNTPVHIAYDQFSRKAFAMNSTLQAVNGATATLKVYDIYGDQINETLTKTFDLPADGVTSWSGTTVDRLTGFIPNQRNGDDWFEGSFEPFYTMYSTANAAGRRAAGTTGNFDLWNNTDIVGSLIKPTTDVYFVSLELKDKDGGLVSRNDYAVARKREVISTQSSAGRAMSQAADLTQVNLLPKVDLLVTQNHGGLRANDKSMWEQTVTITNPTGDVAFGVELKAYTDSTKAHLTPANYSDNLLILYPGETRTVRIWHLADNLGGRDAFIGVNCYNNIISGEERNLSRGNNYVPGDPDSAEWVAWGLAPQTQTSATTNLARNVGSSVATVASNSTGPNTMATNTGNAPTRITNATFVTFANERANSVLDSIMADGATSSTTGYAQIPVGSAHYINLGEAKTFDKVISRWNENSYQEWNPCMVGRGVPDRVRLQISAATGATADWNNLLYDETFDNTAARSYIVEFLLDKAYSARHIRLIPDGVTGASDPFGVQLASERLLQGAGYGRDSGWDRKSGRLNDQVVKRDPLNRFSLTSVEVYHTYNHLDVNFIGRDNLKATVNGKAIAASDAPINKTAYAFYGDKINIALDERLFVYLDMVDVNDKLVAADGKYTLALDATNAPAVLTISDTPLVTVSLNTDEVSYINGDVTYTASLAGAVDVLAVELEFLMDGDLLAGKGLVGLNGFDSMNGILWIHAGDNKWKGTVTLALPSGSTTGLTSAAPVDIAKFTFTPKGFGNATVALTSARVVFLNDTTKFVTATIVNGTATTIIARSKYDLNRDGVVDALDLGIMLLYCGFNSDALGWDDFIKVNDIWGNGVSARMCDVNGDGLIDMLDLLDLFIHYTK
ncbi:MAG: dockerin type I domain-containing protein, partial [Clostridiales bacterium]|nr:dockerin type I domain-containing protein [Clostridiales bacterium]